MQKSKQPLHQHLLELRRRLFIVVGVLLGSTAIAALFMDQIQKVLIQPLDEKLYYTSPAGGVSFSFQTVLIVGMMVAFPFLAFHTIRFIEPIMNKSSTKKTYTLVTLSMLLALLGASFAYFVSLPAALNFLTNFSDKSLQSLITTQDYLSFLSIYLLGFVLIFQIPLILYIINNITPLPPSKMIGGLRIVTALSVVVAAIITPTTDPINLSIMAVPMILLYLLSILMLWFVNRKRGVVNTKSTVKVSEQPTITKEEVIPSRHIETPVKRPSAPQKYLDIITPQNVVRPNPVASVRRSQILIPTRNHNRPRPISL